jgi:glycosyltransferase involved in cell wall biosynthesis
MISNNRLTVPLVSICIPTYNGEKYIEEALNSALNQTYKSIEIIISDANSDDKTLDVVSQIKKNTKIPFFIYNYQQNGIGSNWNNCVRKASGKYIKFLFQDDIIFPNCIEKMMQIALKDKQIGLVFSKRNFLYTNKNNYVDDMNKDYRELHIYWANLKSINSGTRLLKKCNCLLDIPQNKVGEPTVVLLKKEVFFKVGFFNETLIQILDYEFWYRVFKYYKIGFINEELASFRLHEMQASQINNKSYVNEYLLYDKFLYENLFFQLSPNIQKQLFKKYNKLYNLLRRIKRKLKISFEYQA